MDAVAIKKTEDASAVGKQGKAKAQSSQNQGAEKPPGQDKDAKAKASNVVSKTSQESKEKIQKAAESAKAAAIQGQGALTEVKKKVSAATPKVATKSHPPAEQAATSTQPLSPQFHDELAKLVKEAESALALTIKDISQSAAVSPSESDASASKPASDGAKKKDEKILTVPLPIGFEPPPGYSRPKPSSNSAPIGLLRYPPQNDEKSEALPKLSSSIKVSEPVISHIASTIDELASLLKGSPYSSTQAHEVLDNAKNDLAKLVNHLEKIREEAHAKLEAQLDEQAREYSLKALESDLGAQDKLVQQESEFKEFFEEEKRKFLKHYREKLDNELKAQSELIDERFIYCYIVIIKS